LSVAAAATRAGPAALDRRASVVAVHAARGGAGATFVATHLARAFARRGSACILVDGDPSTGEVGPAVGAPEEDVHTLADLVPLAAELTPAHLDDTMWTHPDGFRVLLAPPADGGTVEASHVRRAVDVAATATDVVVLHLPHAIDGYVTSGCETADRIVEVLTLDVLSFRSSKRAVDALRPLGVDGRLGFVVNRAARAEITPNDVVRVFGCEPLAVVPRDRAVAHAQDHGRLVGARSRIGRAFDRLAGVLRVA
jgi:pilus assembly protein CpaE